ncbi:MAG TPA: 1,4-alpha-glucan branching protein GlgB [bacterium]|nr:1,4-alpha-glucan branching protein GlgB [bacterium]HOL47800.1 1,4-alpha-glucan branching protein GlgB [bacterium]HPQ19092.1 1,4-alpha-glucan branching protein GlgB [bacterium]
MLTTIPPEEAIEIIHSSHNSPHKILGMHIVNIKIGNEEKKVPVVRAFLPEAKEIYVVEKNNKKNQWQMEKIHNNGLFEAIIWDRTKKFSYKFKIKNYYGHEWESEDAYEMWVEEITPFDRYLFNRSRHYKIYEKLGAHVKVINGKKGVFFSVWAPNAKRVSVIGNFNNWDGRRDQMELLKDSGVWVLFKPGLDVGELYKFEIKTKKGKILQKSDPYAFYSEVRPKTASIVYTLEDFKWNDNQWIEERQNKSIYTRPLSIYEVHLGSWQRIEEENNRFLTYSEYVDRLIPYVKEMGFTHIELLPIEEHPFDGSWGYQVTGYFAPTSRFGSPHQLQYFIDKCHQAGIGVILDWVPAHFPKDPHGLIQFDGTHLYEHADPRQGEHPDWGTKIFNYGRYEVRNFLISNALYWIDKFHFDGLRVDAVAAMLYLDYSRKPGEWIPNKYGGRENLEAIEFLKHLNSVVHKYFPGVMMIAEESTAWPGVSKPVYSGGLGFDFKWNMGWMHDVIEYMKKDPIYRKYHHRELTFSFLYAWSEHFILPFSHDEVVHRKGSMIRKMPGDEWQRFANLRALYTYMWTHPGKKMLFMGQEFGQKREWSESRQLDWYLLKYPFHQKLKNFVKDLNALYKREKALWEVDFHPSGFDGINCDDCDNSVLSFIRYANDKKDFLVIAINFTPVPRYKYILGVPEFCFYKEIFNSNSENYGGSNLGNNGGVMAKKIGAYRKPYSIEIVAPPLGAVIFKPIYK